jgi:hypothetical protein
LGERFAKFPSPADWIDTIGCELIAANDPESLATIVQAFRKRAPSDPNGDYYAAQVHMLREEYEPAARLLRAAFPRVDDAEERQYYVSSYFDAMLELEQSLKAYSAAPDPGFAFTYLAEELADRADAETLTLLVALHRRSNAEDKWLPFYTGRAHAILGDFKRAEQAFAAGMSAVTDEADRETYRWWRVDARCEAGYGLKAYSEIDPKEATFAQLAERFWYDDNYGDLSALIAAHKKGVPKDPALAYWEAEVCFEKRDYEQAVRLLAANRTSLFADDERVGRAESVLVRSLARLKRFDEALVEARESTRRDGDPYFELVVHAVAGDVENAARVLGECIKQGYHIETFYEDLDIARALRSNAFAKLRDKFPDPFANGDDEPD